MTANHTPDSLELVRRARSYAAQAHGDHRRKHVNEPFTEHLCRVAGILHAFGVQDPVVIAAAHLHDTVEDTDTRVDDLLESFGEEIAELVYWLTDADSERVRTAKLATAWRLAHAPWNAKLIKLADLIDNSEIICREDRPSAPAYLQEKARILDCMARVEGPALTRLAIFKEACRIGSPD